jgi:hypothetical protein
VANTAFDGFEPRLEHIFDMHADLEAPQVIPGGPLGERQIFVVKGGTLEGPRIKGVILPGGGDWATRRADGVIQLDVRATIKTDDDAIIYAQYSGLLDAPMETIVAGVSGNDPPLTDYYFYTNPMFQTGSEKYAWLNRVVAVGRGRIVPSAAEYRVWATANPA